MNELFQYIKNNILNGMPYGCLVSSEKYKFLDQNWQYKTYKEEDNIRNELRSIWCPSTINILLFSEDVITPNIIEFLKNNLFEMHGRHMYLVYTLAIPTTVINEELSTVLIESLFPQNKFSKHSEFNGYTVYLNNFMKDITHL